VRTPWEGASHAHRNAAPRPEAGDRPHGKSRPAAGEVRPGQGCRRGSRGRERSRPLPGAWVAAYQGWRWKAAWQISLRWIASSMRAMPGTRGGRPRPVAVDPQRLSSGVRAPRPPPSSFPYGRQFGRYGPAQFLWAGCRSFEMWGRIPILPGPGRIGILPHISISFWSAIVLRQSKMGFQGGRFGER
jgi:hypothetical protein